MTFLTGQTRKKKVKNCIGILGEKDGVPSSNDDTPSNSVLEAPESLNSSKGRLFLLLWQPS